ncbi:MAG: helix-turn-helix domain-containing protein [Cellvibrio sp.]
MPPSSNDISLEFVGNRLKQLREIQGFSQRELAKRSGITHSNISMIEQGQVSPSIQSINRILNALSVSPQDFFRSTNPSPVSLVKLDDSQSLPSLSAQLSPKTGECIIEPRTFGAGATARECQFITLFDASTSPLLAAGERQVVGSVLIGDALVTTTSGEYYLTQGDVFSFAPGEFFCFIQQGRKTTRLCLT